MRFRKSSPSETPTDGSSDPAATDPETTPTGGPESSSAATDQPQADKPKESRALKAARRKEKRLEKKIAKQEVRREREAARALIEADKKAADKARSETAMKAAGGAGQTTAPIHPDPSRPTPPGTGPSTGELLAEATAAGEVAAVPADTRTDETTSAKAGASPEAKTEVPEKSSTDTPDGGKQKRGIFRRRKLEGADQAQGASAATGAVAATGSKKTSKAGPAKGAAAPTAKPTSPATTSVAAADEGDSTSRPGGRRLLAGLGLLAVGAGVGVGISELTSDDEAPIAPAPTVITRDSSDAEAADELGFPAFATKNTTRIGGADPEAVAAAAALAAYPAQGGVPGPPAVTLVESGNWQGAVAGSVFASEAIGAPILVGEQGSTPDFTRTALEALDPQGSSSTGGAELIALGNVQVPAGLKTEEIDGASPAELAASIDAVRAKLVAGKGNSDGAPDHLLIVSAAEPEFALPAAAWAAFSGDPVLFVQENIVPPKTLEVLRKYKKASAYLLGPESVVSEKVFRKLRAETGSIRRIAGETPVENAIEFARFTDGSFGWGLIDPGHGFVISGLDQPVSTASASILSRIGSPGPLLLTDKVNRLPGALDGFLLATKPGYIDNASRAQFNRAWIIGDENAIGIDQQAQIDERIDLTQVGGGSGGPRLGPRTEDEPKP